jgi:HD-GYP domain-containing protein (c-di-GMP phosphodiesterase class II)
MTTNVMVGQPSRWLRVFVAAVFAAGAVGLTAAIWWQPPSDAIGLVVLVALAAASERFAFRLYRDGWVSVAFAAAVLAAVWLGAGAAVLVETAAVLAGFFFTDRSKRKLVFNFGQANLSGLAGALAVAPLPPPAEGVSGAALLVFAGLVAGGAMFLVSAVLVSVAMALDGGRRADTVFFSNFGWLVPHYLAVAAASGGFAAVYANLGVPGLLVLVLPLAASRYAMKQVIDKTREHVLRLERANDELRTAYVEIRQMSERLAEAYHGTLESLVAALDMRDQETRGHSARVAAHAVELARVLGIRDEEELAMIYTGALMHDVGKIGVPDAILRKPGPLTDEEWEFMRRHPALGYRILAQVPYLRPAARIVLAHHERWDGGGYPRGLKGEQIPLGARIFAVCDTYDAIVSDRPYRKGQAAAVALREILSGAGSQFDPRVVEAFESLFPKWERESTERGTPIYLPQGAGRRERRRAS